MLYNILLNFLKIQSSHLNPFFLTVYLLHNEYNIPLRDKLKMIISADEELFFLSFVEYRHDGLRQSGRGIT